MHKMVCKDTHHTHTRARACTWFETVSHTKGVLKGSRVEARSVVQHRPLVTQMHG